MPSRKIGADRWAKIDGVETKAMENSAIETEVPQVPDRKPDKPDDPPAQGGEDENG